MGTFDAKKLPSKISCLGTFKLTPNWWSIPVADKVIPVTSELSL
jgi:hypothetical protein